MLSATNLVFWGLRIFGLLILSTNQVAGSDYTGLLSRLYKKASDSNRPLIMILDNNFLQSEREIHKTHKNRLLGLNQPRVEDTVLYLNDLINKKNRHPKEVTAPYKPKNRKLKKYRHEALFPRAKDKIPYTEEVFKPPIIKSLLRISNNLRCQARNECEDECGVKYNGNKKDNCEDQCEVKYECDEPDPCDKDECEQSDECAASGDCQSSTKGWTLEPSEPGCSRC